MGREQMRGPDLASMRQKASTGEWFRIQARAATDDEPSSADVYIYEQIGQNWFGEGISAKQFARDLDELDVDTIRLYVNSPGGAAWDGVTIMNTLRRHRARVEVVVDGLAASAASVIAMAGDHVTMNRGSELMIHDAWGFAIGNAKDMEDTAVMLGKLSDSLADTYAARAGGTRDHWRELMRAETWYTAEEAVAAGLADEWVDAPAHEAAFDLSRLGFAFMGRSAAPALRLETPKLPSSSEPGDPIREENVVAYDDLTAGLRERLGVTDAAASDETLLAALDEALEERAEPTTEIPAGAQLVDAGVLASLQADAAAGRQALEQQAKARREGIVASAVREGRIAPSSSEQWLASLEKDEEGTSKLLATFAPNTIPVAELGHSDQAEASEEDRLAAKAGWTDTTKEA